MRLATVLRRLGSARSAGASRFLSEPAPRLRAGDLLEGWRYILTHRTLRALFFNTTLGQRPDHGDLAADRRPDARPLGFKPWQYGSRSEPCVGGLIGFTRWGGGLRPGSGNTRSCSAPARCARAGRSLGLAFVRPGSGGPGAGHGGAVRPGRVHGGVQPGVRDLPKPEADLARPGRRGTLSGAGRPRSKLVTAALTARCRARLAQPRRAPAPPSPWPAPPGDPPPARPADIGPDARAGPEPALEPVRPLTTDRLSGGFHGKTGR